MKKGGFLVFEFLGHIPSQAEIRILVDRARNQAGYVRVSAKYLRERVGEGWSSLDGCKVNLANIIPALESA